MDAISEPCFRVISSPDVAQSDIFMCTDGDISPGGAYAHIIHLQESACHFFTFLLAALPLPSVITSQHHFVANCPGLFSDQAIVLPSSTDHWSSSALGFFQGLISCQPHACKRHTVNTRAFQNRPSCHPHADTRWLCIRAYKNMKRPPTCVLRHARSAPGLWARVGQ